MCILVSPKLLLNDFPDMCSQEGDFENHLALYMFLKHNRMTGTEPHIAAFLKQVISIYKVNEGSSDMTVRILLFDSWTVKKVQQYTRRFSLTNEENIPSALEEWAEILEEVLTI